MTPAGNTPRARPPRASLDERVAAVRAELAGADNRALTWLALSGADRETLRVIEAEYFHRPGPAGTLSHRITDAHLMAVARLGSCAGSTAAVTTDIVACWAAETLTDCLPGMTDFHTERGGQFTITLHEPEEGQTCPALVFTVLTILGLDPRRFQVFVSVSEVS